LAASIRAFLIAAGVPWNSLLTAIVVPDALDEAGQQILLDGLAYAGLSPDHVHLLPRPLAVALHWCYTSGAPAAGQVTDDEEGTVVGRLRIITTALDVWEAVSLQLRARRYKDHEWTMPVRDRIQLTDAPPELQTLGLGFALALACLDANDEPLGWWPRVFASDWLEKRLTVNRSLSLQETEAIREVCSSNLPESLHQEFRQLNTLRPLWSRFFQTGPQLRDAISQRWESQERSIGTAALPCTAVLVDGAFTSLCVGNDSTIAYMGLPSTPGATVQVFPPSQSATAKGAALAAAAIAHGLPCYRETLLPLDLYVRGTDEYGDPAPQWRALVAVHSVEAGRLWRSPPVTGLQIQQGQDRLSLPLRRTLSDKPMFRQVGTELATAAKHDEPVRVEVEVKPGQGFARVRIESVTPGVFATRLDWRTMEECDEPQQPQLAYLPGVSRIVPDEQMFNDARPALEVALRALQQNNLDVGKSLSDAIKLLNKWPLAHNVERERGCIVAKDFMLHYGVIGSNGNLDELPEPGLARDLRDTIGKEFGKLVLQGAARTKISNTLLRAGGWFYLAIPQECLDYLRSRLDTANGHVLRLSPEELHAMGLAFETHDDLCVFYPLVVQALRVFRPNNWLRAVRNICRFRNRALHPDTISDPDLYQLTTQLFATLQEQAAQRNFGQIFRNCLETLPFLLKRRRYDPEFLAPTSQLAQELTRFLEKMDRESRWRLPHRLQPVTRATINFLQKEATESDIEALLGVEEESDDA
jgi:hypothetical protein